MLCKIQHFFFISLQATSEKLNKKCCLVKSTIVMFCYWKNSDLIGKNPLAAAIFIILLMNAKDIL